MTKNKSSGGRLGSRLRLAREQAGLSQAQVARMLGVHRPTISEIEAGRRRVTAEELARFAEIYDVSLTWLVGPSGDESDKYHDRIELAARELAKLKPEDLSKIEQLLKMLRTS